MKRKILLNYLKGKYGHYLGESSNTSFVVFGAERVKRNLDLVDGHIFAAMMGFHFMVVNF